MPWKPTKMHAWRVIQREAQRVGRPIDTMEAYYAMARKEPERRLREASMMLSARNIPFTNNGDGTLTISSPDGPQTIKP